MNKKITLLDNEMIVGLFRAAQIQKTVYEEFLRLNDGCFEEAIRQTEIFMRAFFHGTDSAKQEAQPNTDNLS